MTPSIFARKIEFKPSSSREKGAICHFDKKKVTKKKKQKMSTNFVHDGIWQNLPESISLSMASSAMVLCVGARSCEGASARVVCCATVVCRTEMNCLYANWSKSSRVCTRAPLAGTT